MRAVAVCMLVACSAPVPRPKSPERDAPDPAKPSAPRPAARVFPAPPTGFSTSDVVAMLGGVLVAYAIVGGKLVETGRTTIVAVDKGDEPEALLLGIGHGDWADRDHLFVTIGKRDVVMVTATAITEVPIPSEEVFKTPQPPPTADGTELDAGGDADLPHTGLIVTKGEAWWAACPWGQALDGFQCHGYINARLWPTAVVKTNASKLPAIAYPWPTSIPNHTIKTIDSKTLACETANKKTLFKADSDPDEEIEGTHWVSTTPPRLLVRYGHAGLADVIADRWTLHDGCTPTPLAGGVYATPGPAGLWIATGDQDESPPQVVYRFGAPVGELPNHARVWPRPAK